MNTPVNALNNVYTKLLWIIALGAVLWLFVLLRPVLLPFVVGALLAYLSNPWVERLARWHIGRTLATVIVLLLLVFIIGTGVYWS